MPLVFVHGVNTRDSDDYRDNVSNQEKLFAHVALRGLAVAPMVTHPYWGSLGAQPAWGNASVPDGDFESFGTDEQLALLIEESASTWPQENPLLAIANHDFARSIDVLWTLLPDTDANSDLAELGAKSIAYAEANRNPGWLNGVANDQQFLTELEIHIDAWEPLPGRGRLEGDEWESFGVTDVWHSVREGASRLVGLPGRAVGSPVLGATRSMVHGHLSRFIGDILVYLKNRGTAANPGRIPQLVSEAIGAANQATSRQDPHVIVVGHSMGGNILYDVLSHYRPHLQVDSLITVGSQVGMFEEMKVFQASDSAIPGAAKKVAKPDNVTHWINIFDRHDILSFVAGPVFEAVEDFAYSTGASALGAHTSYFKRPSFHKRLNERLKAVLEP